MVPARLAPVLFGPILSGLMSLLVSGIAIVRATGLPPDLPWLWMSAWLSSWAVAFPTVRAVAPVARRPVARLTAPS